MRSRLALLAHSAALVLSLACGGSGPAPGPSDGVAAPPAAPPSGSPPATPPPPSTSAPGPGQLLVERLDPDAECDGLAPERIPEPVSARVENPGGRCLGGVSDGTGHVAVAIAPGLPWNRAQLFSPAGAPLARFDVWGEVAPQPDGWIIALGDYSHGPGSVSILSLLPDGSERGGQTFAPVFGRSWEFGADPRGGCFVVVHPFMDGASVGPPPPGGHWVDAAGSLVGGAVDVGSAALAAGVSTRGDALVLQYLRDQEGRARTFVHWIRPDGSHAIPPTDEGDVYPTVTGIELAPLLDGSLAVRSDGAWSRRYPHLAAAGEAAPAWLAARGRETFRFTRGTRGYAFFPVPSQAAADCRQAFELLAPSGRRCVRITLREEAAGCTTGVVDQGRDGTVVQQSGTDPCSYRWWPGLLGE